MLHRATQGTAFDRLSLAGADAGTFSTLTDAPATWSVSVGSPDGSTLHVPTQTVPTQPWPAAHPTHCPEATHASPSASGAE